MFKKIGLLTAAVLCTINIYAVTFTVNGSLWNTVSDEGLSKLTCGIKIADEYFTAVSLDELFPAVYTAWRMGIKTEGSENSTRLSDPDLGDTLSRIWLVKSPDGWNLMYKSRFFKNIDSINLDCEPLENDPLEIWINWEGIELLRNEIQRYAELHKTEIKITQVPKPDSKLVSVSQAGGRVPDIIMVQSSDIDRLSSSDSIQYLDYMFPNDVSEQARRAFTYNGRVWAIPFYYDTQMVFLNPNILEVPAASWTLADFEMMCAEAENAGYIPSAWNSYSASFLIPFQMAFGKQSLVEPDGSIIIDDLPTLQALEWVLDLQKRGLMQPMERDAMTSLFIAGETAMIISASYSIPHYLELGIPFEAVPLPVNSATGIRVSPLLDYKAFAITKRSRNTAGARRLIEYLCGLGVQQRFTTATAKLPALESARALMSGSRWNEALGISSDAGTIIPTEKAYSIYKNTMWKMLRFAISGRMPAEEVLEKTQELVNKNLEDRE